MKEKIVNNSFCTREDCNWQRLDEERFYCLRCNSVNFIPDIESNPENTQYIEEKSYISQVFFALLGIFLLTMLVSSFSLKIVNSSFQNINQELTGK